MRLARWVAGAAAVLAAGAADAQTFPDKPLKLIVTVAAGAPADTICRVYADEISKRVGQPMITENRPGGNSVIAIEALLAAPPDGYTLGCLPAPSMTPALHRSLPFDFLKAAEPVVGVFRFGLFLTVSGKLPVKTYDEFIAYAKANPGKLNYFQLGPSQKIGFALFAQKAGIEMTEIAYKGQEAYQDLFAGVVHAGLDGPALLKGQLEAGVVRMFFTAASVRSPLLPNIPTAAELGLKDLELTSGLSIWTRAGAPRSAVMRVNTAMNEAMREPKLRDMIVATGGAPVGGTPENLREVTERDFRIWTEGARVARFVPPQ